MRGLEQARSQAGAETQDVASVAVQPRRNHDTALGVEADEPAIERSVELGREQEAVEDIEALSIGLAHGPWLDVAGSQQRRDRQPGDDAAPFPVVEQSLARDVLSDALDDEPLGLGRTRELEGLLLEGDEQLMRQGLGELEGAAKQLMEGRDRGDRLSRKRARGQRVGHRDAVLTEGSRDVEVREGDQQYVATEGGEPDAKRGLGACEGQPVACAGE